MEISMYKMIQWKVLYLILTPRNWYQLTPTLKLTENILDMLFGEVFMVIDIKKIQLNAPIVKIAVKIFAMHLSKIRRLLGPEMQLNKVTKLYLVFVAFSYPQLQKYHCATNIFNSLIYFLLEMHCLILYYFLLSLRPSSWNNTQGMKSKAHRIYLVPLCPVPPFLCWIRTKRFSRSRQLHHCFQVQVGWAPKSLGVC